jgi:hypothetical protein
MPAGKAHGARRRAAGTRRRVLQAAASRFASSGAAAHDEADHHTDRHHQQADHEHRSEFLAEAEVRGQRGQAEAGGESGQRPHPRTLGLACGCRGHRAWRLRWRDGGFVGGGGLTLHAGGLAAAQTFAGGFRIAERKCTAQCQNGGEQ